jgi:hypothetical protein
MENVFRGVLIAVVFLLLWRLEQASERLRVIMAILQDWDKQKEAVRSEDPRRMCGFQ